MPDVPTSKPVLAGKPVRTGAQIAVEALPEGHLLQVMGAAGQEDMKALIAAAGLQESALHSAGYSQWYVTGESQLTAAAVRDIAATLPTGIYLSDQSHGRVRIRVSGTRATELLAKGTAVDLYMAAFPVGQATITLFGHISVHLARTGDTEFELTVLRSFAEALHEELEASAA